MCAELGGVEVAGEDGTPGRGDRVRHGTLWQGVGLPHGQAGGAGLGASERRPGEGRGPGCSCGLMVAFSPYSTSHPEPLSGLKTGCDVRALASTVRWRADQREVRVDAFLSQETVASIQETAGDCSREMVQTGKPHTGQRFHVRHEGDPEVSGVTPEGQERVTVQSQAAGASSSKPSSQPL